MGVIGVYMIEHLPTGRRYVGWSHDVRKRIGQHFFPNPLGHERSYLHRAIVRHGRKQFAWLLLESFDSDDRARAGEVEWIRRLGTKRPRGFNLTDGGDGCRGLKWTEDSRARKAAWAAGRKDSPATLERKRAARLAYLAGPGGDVHRATMATLRGSKRSEMTRALMSAKSRGRRHTEESKAKISAAKMNPSEETRLKISLSGIGRRHNDEAKAKIGAAAKARAMALITSHGHIPNFAMTPERCAVLAAATKAYWANRKAAAHGQ
jgi:group I intron endonuclease